jgi:hypothetical protein
LEDVWATQSDPEAAERTAVLTEAKPGLFTVVGEFTT